MMRVRNEIRMGERLWAEERTQRRTRQEGRSSEDESMGSMQERKE